MNLTTYCGYRFPPEIISHSVWMYHRFCLSLRDVEELLAKRGILVTYETIRQWWRYRINRRDNESVGCDRRIIDGYELAPSKTGVRPRPPEASRSLSSYGHICH